jgi:hypothetical protein
MANDQTTDAAEELGRSIDNLDNVAHALKMPIPDKMHVEIMRSKLPKLVAQMKRQFAAVTGNDPWEDHPL